MMRSFTALVLGALTCACGKPAGTGVAPSASSSARAAPSPSLAAVASHSAEPVAAAPTCRALRVIGDAKVGEVPLVTGAEVDGSEWVTLAAGANLTLKHTQSGRELAVAGPALFRACRRGREQLLLAKGTVQAGVGMGARPGAEVLIATPVAAVRYAEAGFQLKLTDKRLELQVSAGQLELDSASDKPLKSPLRAKEKLQVPLGKPDATQLMARCQVTAEEALASARKVSDSTSTEPLGERAAAHVKARKKARSTCTIAAAAIGLVADPTRSAGLWADAARWEGMWETIPRPARAKPPEN